jgi:hypothetical protein
MTDIRSAWLLDSGQSREDTRATSLGALTPASAVGSRTGVLPGSPDGLTRIAGFGVTGSGMTATVAGGRAVIQSDSDDRGAYQVALTSPTQITFADGDPLHSRVDLLVIKIYDDYYDGTGRTEASLEVVQGAADGSNAVPAVPAVAIPLYQVAVPAGASAGGTAISWSTGTGGGLLDRRAAVVAVGGILPAYSGGGAGAYPGQYADVSGVLQRWNGSAWQPYQYYPSWQSWTPTWSTTTGKATPSWGNAALDCRFIQFGPVVHLSMTITFGSTTVFGSGATGNDNWQFTLPVPAAASQPQSLGWADFSHDSNLRAIGRLRCFSTTLFGIEIVGGQTDGNAVAATGLIDSISPWTWASGHALHATATYEAGS